jgi:hypothetical protein
MTVVLYLWLAIALSPLSIALTIAVGFWILRPIAGLKGTEGRSFRFTISDLLSLCVMFQVPTGLAYGLLSTLGETRVSLAPLAIAIFPVSCLYWFLGVSLLTPDALASGAHRMAYLSLVIPMAFIGAPLCIVVAMSVSIALLFANVPNGPLVLMPWAAVGVCLGLAAFASGRYTHWLAQRIRPPGEDE